MRVLIVSLGLLLIYTLPPGEPQNSAANTGKVFKELFDKPDNTSAAENHNKEILSRVLQDPFCRGCTNYVAKVLYPTKINSDNGVWNTGKYIYIPIWKERTSKYKVLVVTTPKHLRIHDRTVIYILLPENHDNINTVPNVYFVDSSYYDRRTTKIDPVIVMNKNRTVTGIKSKEISKMVKFRNRDSKRFNRMLYNNYYEYIRYYPLKRYTNKSFF